MQISVLKKDNLKHEYKVTVPSQTIDDQLQTRLMQIGKTANLPGFRPGKIPMNILKQKFGQRVMGEVLEITVQETTQKALEEQKIIPALQPRISIEKFDEGKDLEFKLTVEVMPEVKMIDFAGLKLERPVADVTEDEINRTLERFSKQFKDSRPIESPRAAKTGDLVIIDFVGRLNGEAFPGGTAQDTKLELGSGMFLPDFEKAVPGMKAGETKKAPVSFPENYGSKNLAGQTAEFEITVKEIHEIVAPELNDEMAKKAGFDTLAALKDAIREQIQAEFEDASRLRLKRNLLDALAVEYSFDIPEGLYQQEYDAILKQYKHAQGHEHGGTAEQDNSEKGSFKLDAETRKELEEIAVRRVRLGIVLAEVGRANKIQVNDDELRQAVLREAHKYPGQEQRVIEYFQKNPQAIQGLTAPILEDKVCIYISELAQVTESKVTPEELFAEPEEDKKDKKAAASSGKSKSKAPSSSKAPAEKKAPAKGGKKPSTAKKKK